MLPSGGNIILNYLNKISAVNRDTIWGVGGTVFQPGYGNRGMIFRTTNGGNNWLYQHTDTSIHTFIFYHIKFINKNIGWAYTVNSGIHTITGGNDTLFTGLSDLNINSKLYHLFQNYPNPFNPVTKIKFSIKIKSSVKLIVYDINGKEVQILIKEKLNKGEYQTDFSAKYLSSGVYFYRMIAETQDKKSIYIDTKKMMLIK